MGSPDPKDTGDLALVSVHVRAISPSSRRGVVIAGNLVLPCILGRAGAGFLKREGDGATPRGTWRFRQIFARAPVRRFLGSLPRRQITRQIGWCDDPADRNYNREVHLPYPASHERLWRDDHLYDVFVTLNHNERPRRRFGGSAIFLHLADRGGRPTAGCVALSRKDLLKLLPLCGPRTRLVVW
jgi:L,D-peptidoglycan transpeptidase YkuD (ErfK/YbiS/YcfS/YnhG family)